MKILLKESTSKDSIQEASLEAESFQLTNQIKKKMDVISEQLESSSNDSQAVSSFGQGDIKAMKKTVDHLSIIK